MKRSALAEVLYALRHHGKSLKPLTDSLVYGLMTSLNTIEPVPKIRNHSHRAVINDVLYYFYFKPDDDPRIEVRREGSMQKTTLRSERDILRWIKALP